MDKSDDNTITMNTVDWGDLTIDSIDMSNYSVNIPASSNYTFSTGATGAVGSMGYATGINNGIWGSTVSGVTGSSGLYVQSDAIFDGDIKWKGRSLGKLLETIEDRLAILTEPSPEKLAKFAALKKAYDNYKLLERLIGDDDGSNTTE
jgi:hypothetical protein